MKPRRFETLKRGRRRLEKIVLHSALLEMSLSPGQMAVVKVLLPSLEVFDLGAEIFISGSKTQVQCWEVTGCIYPATELKLFFFFFRSIHFHQIDFPD